MRDIVHGNEDKSLTERMGDIEVERADGCEMKCEKASMYEPLLSALDNHCRYK